MSGINFTIRIDPELKKAADEVFSDLGLNLTTAITLFLKASVRYDGIPFELRRIETLEMKQVLSEFDEINKSPESYKQYDSINAIIMEAMSYD